MESTIASPFYNTLINLAYSFKGQSYKRARSTIKLYALVFVCILTGATNILVWEELETQDVIHALDCHSSKYGVPGELFIDNGTQLKALEHAKLSIRDLDT